MATLYDELLSIARDYMGVAAEDYIRRRIRIVNRGESPETIQPDRLERLAIGIDMTAKGYMSPDKAHAFREEILGLKKKFKNGV